MVASSERRACTRVGLVVRPRLLREMLVRLIGRHPRLCLVGSVSEPARLERVLTGQAPQCLVVTLDRSGNLDEDLRRVCRRHPGLRLVVLSAQGRLLRTERGRPAREVDTAEALLETLCHAGSDEDHPSINKQEQQR
ncbi:MAG: hypothetical protein KatS3mg042_0278 [Rhodothermaceae bacterium]|nr:MAG: hypothetical protein KatS3mg042_0278 [Rhodothermaceae bacterium]